MNGTALPRVFLEPVDGREFEPGGRLHGLTEATRAELGLPVWTRRHLALRRAARSHLARDEAGRDVAAYHVTPEGTLFEMDALFATDTERLCMSFRALLATGAVASVHFRSDDSLLLPLALSRLPPTAEMVTHRTLLAPGVAPLIGAVRDELARYVELAPGDAAALATAAAAEQAAGRIPFVELPQAQFALARELLGRGFRELHFLLRVAREQVVDSSPTVPREDRTLERLLAEERRQHRARRKGAPE